MKSRHSSPTIPVVLFVAAVLSGITALSSATSRMGWAVISESEGKPCFLIPSDPETKHGLPLRGLSVTELPTGNWQELPEELWGFTISNGHPAPTLSPDQCIIYGASPLGAKQRSNIPLKFFHIYFVSINAKKEGSNMTAYIRRFCLRSDDSGKVTVHTVPPGEQYNKQLENICISPK